MYIGLYWTGLILLNGFHFLVIFLSSSNFFDRLVRHHSTFLSPTTVTQFQWEPLSGGIKYTERGKFVIFDRSCHLFRTQYEIGLWLYHGSLSGSVGSQLIFVISSDLERWDTTDLCNLARTV